jgi:DUF4097 and DUF4098 domain-containing protein YvlB
MSKALKIWFLVGAALILVGGLIFICCLAIGGWNITSISDTSYETTVYEFTEDVSNILIHGDTADIKFAPSGDQKIKVECLESKNESYSVTVTDGTLNIQSRDSAWYNDITFFSFTSPKITVYLPQGEYNSLTIKSDTGDIEVAKEFSFASIDIDESTGDVACYVSASEFTKIKATTGKVHVENTTTGALDLSVSTGSVSIKDVTCYGDVKVGVSTGKVHLTNFSCNNLVSNGDTGDIFLKNVTVAEELSVERSTGDVAFDGSYAEKLAIKTDTGDVSFDRSDAAELYVKTDTGSVTGSLLTRKVFLVRSNTGKITVPDFITGGRCEITTDTGDIIITVN